MKGIKFLILQLLLLAVLSPSAGAAELKILFLRKTGKGFDEVFDAMKKELSRKFVIEDFAVTRETSYEDTKRKISEASPNLFVTMDNLSISHAIRFNEEQSDAKSRIHGVALMGLNLKSVLKNSKDFSGVSFESPAYTMLTQFRYLLKKPITKVLAFYRKSVFQDTMELSSKQLAREGIELQLVNAEAEGTGKEAIEKLVEKNLKKEAVPEKCDAVWVVLDSGLLTPHLFRNLWLPTAREAKVPFVSGTEEFVSLTADFATFVVTPNLADLANQATQQVESQLLEHTPPIEIGVEELTSVNKIINLDRARKLGLSLKDENLKDIKILQ